MRTATKLSALVTAATDDYISGTLATLYSFRKHNPWFGGETIVFYEHLSPSSRAILNTLPGVSLQPVSEALIQRLDRLERDLPRLRRKRGRFFSLELFSLNELERVLFVDSDLLFKKSIEDLLSLDHEFIACGEMAFYTRQVRDRDTYGLKPAESPAKTVMARPFNSGLMLASNSLLRAEIYQSALAQIDARHWVSGELKHTDQFILNRLLENRTRLASAEYNYLLVYRNEIKKSQGLCHEQAKVWHFNGPKPWSLPGVWPRFLIDDPVWLFQVSQWRQTYAEAIRADHSTRIGKRSKSRGKT